MKSFTPLFSALFVAAITMPSSAQPVAAAETATDENVFVMGGPFSTEYFGDTLAFWDNTYESNVFAGIGYQYFFHSDQRGLKLGLEAGTALRLGDRASAEVWAGGVIRADFQVGDVTIAPALTAGLSVVTDEIGVEAERADQIGRAVPVLFYLGPEISASHAAMPNVEVLARVQHRSGGFGTIAPIDGSNAAVLGLRYNF